VTAIVSIWLALVLALAAALKARRAGPSAAALATYGVSGEALQRVTLALLLASEAVIAIALAAGAAWARVAAACLLAAFAVAGGAALLAGRGGRECACFGSSSRLSALSLARSTALAVVAGVAALGWLPQDPAGYDRWLTLGLSLSLAAAAALGVAVFALAREVGVLRLSAGARGALEIPGEGPELGSSQAWGGLVQSERRAPLGLAVFTSDGCPLCAQVAPAVAHIAGDPLLAVRIFDEHGDAAVWREAEVPGSPYAIALSDAGTVLAKGTFNSLAQLESVLATARFREQGLSLAA
jgi:hypothetical protein